MWYKVKKIYQWTNLVRPVWKPWANTLGYWTFDDQNVNQITDVSWNWNTLVYGAWNKITYSLLSWTDYYWNFNRSQYWKDITWISNYTWCMWCKISQTWQQYITMNNWIDLIYWFNSWQIEVYDYYWWSSYRSTLKSNTQLNTWMCIWFSKNWSTVTTYYNWSKVWTPSFANYQLTGVWIWWNQSQWLIWSLNNVILEDRVWSDSDWSNYYNLTKSNYWL